MARASGSYPEGHRFKSRCRYQGTEQVPKIRPGGQAVKTPPFHGGNTSSILVRVTNKEQSLDCFFVLCNHDYDESNSGEFLRKENIPVEYF